MLRKFTIARYVETGEIVEDSLAGWNPDPISEVGLVGGISGSSRMRFAITIFRL